MTKNKTELDNLTIEYILDHGDNQQIVSAIHSAADYQDNPEFILKICQRFYSHHDFWVSKAAIDVLSYVDFFKLKFDPSSIIVEILRYGFQHDNYEAESAFFVACKQLSREQKIWIKNQLQEFYEKFDLKQYDYLFASEELIKESLAKVQKREKELKFCCDGMLKAIADKTIEYDMRCRYYYANVSSNMEKDIKCCPWCKTHLGDNLVKKYFYILKEEYNIKIPDMDNFTNIPDEFKTDEWWKKRGL